MYYKNFYKSIIALFVVISLWTSMASITKAANSITLKSSKMYNAEVQTNNSRVLLKDLTGNGKKIIFLFFSDYCLQCHWELDSLNKILPELAKKNIEVIGIAIDSKNSKSAIQEFVKEKNPKMKIVYDLKDEAKNIYQIRTLPHTMVVNNSGRIVYEVSGFNKETMPFLRQVFTEVAKIN
jgi:peroxiredoxin